MDAFNPREFRNALGRFASGVTVITAHHEDHTHGMTANAFVSVSLDPPLVLVSLDNRSNMHRILPNARRYGVSVLAEGQEALSNHFAGQPIPGVNFSFHMRQGIPLLEGAVAHFESHDKKPLLFYAGRYQQLRSQKQSNWSVDELSLFSIGGFDPIV